MLLTGKKLLITGVLTKRSIAFSAAQLAQQEGAEVVLTSFGRALPITRRIAEDLPRPCEVWELDLTQPDQLAGVADKLNAGWGELDGLLHAVAFAPASALDGNFLHTSWDDVARVMQVSTYSFPALTRACAPLLAAAGGGSVVGLDFDASQAWPGYDWMGVAKAGLESCCRYLAHALGPQGTRVNLVAAGPLRTRAATAIGAFDVLKDTWTQRSPLPWNETDATPVGRAVCALWSDWMPAVTGEVLHVDGGLHAVATAVPRDADRPARQAAMVVN
ncbi:enoyl-ACP reductase FabI [Salinispora cortesiana]|uniref:enoyl-ACP reductase FabI n=1 Tax=Salinispora cortesiana TaxID=1305843 RepID=UPI00042A47D0|nr:enoyl-ACP reductase FabI [Salinispora cortesiana]